MAQIKIHRKNELSYSGRTFKIIVDGKLAGKLEAGTTASITLTPGEHELKAAMGWLIKSNTVRLSIKEDEVREFQVGAFKKGFFTSFIEITPHF